MKDVTNDNFGIAIAYILPGFVSLWGVSLFSQPVRGWLTVQPDAVSPTIGGFLYVTLCSLALGLTVSTVRWAIIDSIHRHTGLARGALDYAALPGKTDAYEIVVGNQYRYYQFYANMFVAIAFAFISFQVTSEFRHGWIILPVLVLEVIFWLGARDTLRNYYQRMEMLLGNESISRGGSQLKAKSLKRRARRQYNDTIRNST